MAVSVVRYNQNGHKIVSTFTLNAYNEDIKALRQKRLKAKRTKINWDFAVRTFVKKHHEMSRSKTVPASEWTEKNRLLNRAQTDYNLLKPYEDFDYEDDSEFSDDEFDETPRIDEKEQLERIARKKRDVKRRRQSVPFIDLANKAITEDEDVQNHLDEFVQTKDNIQSQDTDFFFKKYKSPKPGDFSMKKVSIGIIAGLRLRKLASSDGPSKNGLEEKVETSEDKKNNAFSSKYENIEKNYEEHAPKKIINLDTPPIPENDILVRPRSSTYMSPNPSQLYVRTTGLNHRAKDNDIEEENLHIRSRSYHDTSLFARRSSKNLVPDGRPSSLSTRRRSSVNDGGGPGPASLSMRRRSSVKLRFITTCAKLLVKNRRAQPLQRFKRAARLVHIILTAIRTTRRENAQQESKLMSFAQLQDDFGSNKTTYGDGLDFDPVFYKALKEHHIAPEAKVILEMTPKTRSEEQIHLAIVALNQAVEAFGEFPVKMQQSLVHRGWYERFEAKRVIIRQGHYADNFYFILSGTAVVTILMTDKKTGEPYMNTVAFLKKGNSFGELALMYGGTRNATVTCKDDVELLAVGRDDFVDIFMHVDVDKEPEHINFLRTIDLLSGWPVSKLPYEDPKTCLFTYFRRGVIMCRDSKNMEWIYIIKTGSCRVLKALQPTKADVTTIQTSPDLRLNTGIVQIPKPKKKRRKMLPLDPNLTVSPGLLRLTGQVPKSEKPRNLPPLMRQSTMDVNKANEEHQQTIEKLFNEKNGKTDRASRRVRIQEDKPPPPKPPSGKVFVQVQKLGPKETFGLVQVAFHVMHDTTSMVLVSDGAECVLINKNFFLKHLTEGEHKRLRQTIQPFPTEDQLQQKLQDQMNWDAYKVLAIEKELQESKKFQDVH